MRKIILPVALAIALGTSGIAFAATSNMVVNTVKSFDLKAHTLTLGNGVSYVLPTTFKDPGLKVGSKVKVKWEMKGKAIQADSVTLG